MSFMSGTLGSLLKEGVKHLSGVDEAVLRNIEAVRNLCAITRTSLGPNGMNKMVINHLEKLFVTHDAATIMEQLEVVHPAAKMVTLAAKSQQEEVGDGTNLTVILAGEFLSLAEGLILMGLHPSQILEGYDRAAAKALEILDTLVTARLDNPKDEAQTSQALRTVLSSKLYGNEDHMTRLVAAACVQACPRDPKFFNVDNVRVLKIDGASLSQSTLLNGVAFARDAIGTVKRVENAKIAVFGCGIEPSSTETKAHVELTSAQELKDYSQTEEDAMRKVAEELAAAHVNVVVTSGNVNDMAMHFLEMNGIMTVKIPSKFDIRRLCKSTNATTLVRLGAPAAEEAGYAKSVRVTEIGDTKVVLFDVGDEGSRVSTIVVRGATHNMMDDVERAIDDAVNVYKTLCRASALVPGAGATEIEIAHQLREFGIKQPGLDQYSIQKFAEAFEAVPRILADNSGMNSTDIISALYTAHKAGQTSAGVDIDKQAVGDVQGRIMDSLATKQWAIKYAVDATLNVLRVDQIIMSKPAGGPKPPAGGARDDD